MRVVLQTVGLHLEPRKPEWHVDGADAVVNGLLFDVADAFAHGNVVADAAVAVVVVDDDGDAVPVVPI